MDSLEQMYRAMGNARKETQPSKFWIELNERNLEQLKIYGYENFKQTVALNYFTWTPKPRDEQIRFLIRNLPICTVIKSIMRTFFSKNASILSWKQSLSCKFITYMIWEYTLRQDAENILDKLYEPSEGNPLKVYLHNRLISQDLANSALEFMSIMHSGINIGEIETIMELGGGYGRTAYAFLSLMPKVRYIMVDIPPALYIAEKYISNLFPPKKIFHFRIFNSYSEIEEEFNNAEIIFLLPNQLDLLPPKIADLFINVSSFHEMRPDQIEYYFGLINRLIKKYFYFKQWKISKIPFENIIIKENDYPTRKEWSQIYWRQCKVQTYFFEALFRL